MNELGVEINLSKRYVSDTGSLSFEFASKIVSDGSNVSPFPVGPVLEGRVTSLFQTWTTLTARIPSLIPERGPGRDLGE